MEIYLDTPIQFLKGVGPHFAQILGKRDIRTAKDLLEWYPRAYEDRRAARNIASLKAGEMVSLKGFIVGVKSVPMGRSKRRIYDVSVRDASGTIRCRYFRVPFKGYFDKLEANKEVRIIGKVTAYRGTLEFHHPEIKDVQAGEEVEDALVPIYTETEGITPSRFSKWVHTALDGLKEKIVEPFPPWMLKKFDLISHRDALVGLHAPPQTASKEFVEMTSPYHRRIIFEEFFWMQLYLATKRSGVIREEAPALHVELKNLQRILASLPFELTVGQMKALEEIIQDLNQPHPMHRLLQGDVGSGKTIVALLACALAKSQNFQSAIMVPTEILAEQHLRTAQKFLGQFGIEAALLTGSQKGSERRIVLERLAAGDIHVCIGTHALIQDDVVFKNLGLVIIDEQHRFGVHQRKDLKAKGPSPHFLVMTATPIPRTLAMSVYGDLEVSIIRERPKGRKPIITKVVYPNKRQTVIQYIVEQIQKGRQAFIIYPLVEESEKIDLKNAVDEFEKLKSELPHIRLGLLHGRMKQEEKDAVMERFRKNEVQILVSTTVIEVGVDVPNANVMLVEHAERFGLSQLHQIRGRVGRGEHQSVCILMFGQAVSDEARARMQIMAETEDGFRIAEADLELRGPGEFLGSRQSGLPGFKLANLVRDVELQKLARDAAQEVLIRDPKLNHRDHQFLRAELERQHGPTALAGIG